MIQNRYMRENILDEYVLDYTDQSFLTAATSAE